MKPRTKLSLAAAVVAASTFASSAFAQSPSEVAMKEVEVMELDSHGNPIQDVRHTTVTLPSRYTTIQLGDPPNHANTLGEPAYATAFASDSGTFWVEMNADNQFLPNDNGQGFASTTLLYRMRKDSDTQTPTFNVSGGLLRLTDYGGGSTPLFASVTLEASVWMPQSPGDVWNLPLHEATLEGRGGTPAAETFHYTSQGFDIQPGDYSEVVTSFTLSNGTVVNNVFDALLTIPAQVIPIDLSGVCLDCEFYLRVTAFGNAYNPGGETAATAYLRDPLHFGDAANPELGGPAIDFSGVTVLPYVPAPEPAPLALGALIVLGLALRARRSS
jgi:hypothetical protein